MKGKKTKKKVLIIHTGGTIGMKKTGDGYKPVQNYLESALAAIADMNRPEFPDWELFEMFPLLDSSNMSHNEWNDIARIVYEKYEDYSGFVILHGTDTMAYTASALSFILSGLNKPVILTGSQIPLSEIRSDGRENLITSVLIAAEGVVKEVALCFSGVLLRGNRAMKMTADGLVAFDSPNYPHLAQIGINVKYNTSALLRPQKSNTGIAFRPFSAVPIGVLKIFPGMQFGLFEQIMTEKLSGIVLESFGSGNIPIGKGELLPIISKAFAAGSVVTVTSQCPAGSVILGTYETSSPLKNAGAVSGRDMTTEAAVAKLYHLFSLGLSKEEIKLRMEEDIAGELTP